jgi:hypothetical protein
VLTLVTKNTCKGTLKEHPIISLKADLRGEFSDLFAVLKQQQGQL